MKNLLSVIQRFWSLLALLTLLAVALLAIASPDWYRQYWALPWGAATLLIIFY